MAYYCKAFLSHKKQGMNFFRIIGTFLSKFEKWFEKNFSWFFTNGYKDPLKEA
jgi:hypothetical protein